MKSFFEEFKKFVMRGNVFDLAVGIVIGTSFNAVINSLVNNVITPPFGLLIGKINFADLALNLGGTVQIKYGLFIQSVITFLITALGLFLVIRLLNRIEEIGRRKEKEDAKESAPMPLDSPEVSILKEIRDTLKGQAPVAPPSPPPAEPPHH